MRGTPARFGLLAVFLALAASACGSAPHPGGGGATIKVTQADAGKMLDARVGDTVQIALEDSFPVPGSSLVWGVTSSNTTVLAPRSTSGSPSPDPASHTFTYSAEFAAASAGQAILQAQGVTSCEAMPKQNCPDQTFTVTVVVSA